MKVENPMKMKTAVASAAIVLMMAGAVAPAQAGGNKAKFGSKLNHSIQPSNSVPGLLCDEMNPTKECTFVMNEAYGRPNTGHKAPTKGKLKKIKVISGDTGSFRLQLVKVKEKNGVLKAKVKAEGPMIHLQGQDQQNWETDKYKVEKFKVNMKIKKGWRLAMKATHTTAVRCSSGGDNTLIFPAISKGQSWQTPTDDDGCWPLIEGIIKK
jgi:hypothetical protein